MENRFNQQVAIVAGGARGIGGAVASRLAAEGAMVAILDINQETIKTKVDEIKSEGHEALGFQLDLTHESKLKETIEAIYSLHHRLDIAVNSVGIVGPTGISIIDYPSDQFERAMDVNVLGAFLLTKHVIPFMLQHNYGRVLHVASIGGKEGNPNMVGYATSKSGLMGLVKGVGKEFAETGITINGIAPAVIATEMNLATDPEVLKYMADKIPMKRLGTVEEVAALSCWIVSKEASFNTGYIFDISGGRATY
jgi:3-oxoacyl-[acyl-carrier protein] reductase